MKTKLLLFAILALSINALAQIPTNGLMAYYPFTGNANDLSGSNNNATVYGATLTADRFGNANSAYSFNGTSNYMSTSTAPFTTYPYTISAWVKVNNLSNTGGNPIISLGELGATGLKKCYFDPTYGGNGKPSIGTNGANDITSTSNVVTAGAWKHVVVCVTSYSVSSVTFYVNGIAYTTNTTLGTNIPFPLNNSGFKIGSHQVNTGAASFFNGVIDDLRIYNRVLSACDIDSLYNMPNTSSVGILESNKNINSTIFPNPTSNNTTVIINSSNSKTVTIELFDIIGNIIQKESKQIFEGANKIELDLSNLNTGIYFLRVDNSTQKIQVIK